MKENGFELKRMNGSHSIWSNGEKTVSLPVVTCKPIICNKIIKELGLKT